MNRSLFDISGRVAVITGGSGVLGRNISKGMLQAGVKVMILGKRPENLDQRIAELQQFGEVSGMVCDVLDMECLRDARSKILDSWGQIDILVNAAGGNIPGSYLTEGQTIFDMRVEDYKKVTDLNLNGTVFPCLVFGEVMAERGMGSIINVSSMATYSAITLAPGYSIAKTGVNIFTKWLAAELAVKFDQRIRVNAIAPGFFISDQNRSVLVNPDGSYTERSRKIIAKTPMKRFGELTELNGIVQFLCSDAASFITGAIIPVDGGFSAFSGI